MLESERSPPSAELDEKLERSNSHVWKINFNTDRYEGIFFVVWEQKKCIHAAISGVLGEDDLQSRFKYFAMATGSMIRGK